MKKWPYVVETYSPHEVHTYAVLNQEWQVFRLSLKGLSTEEKLDKLNSFLNEKYVYQAGAGRVIDRNWKVPIDNYINALKRGGFLDLNGEVQK